MLTECQLLIGCLNWLIQMGNPGSVVVDVDSENAAGSSKKIQSSIEPVSKNKKLSKSAAKSRDDSGSNHSSLVQATISTLFKKVGKKVWLNRIYYSN